MTIRPAAPPDVPVIVSLVRALAEYEREPGSALGTEEDFARALFPSEGEPRVFCHLAEEAGEVVGMALWFLTFSTWTGQHGVWLEDLFVRPEHRGTGHGRALLGRLAQVCVERGYPRLEWTVLDWNTPAIELYRSLGSEPMEEWTTHRVSGQALRRLGARATS